uniref:Uncharacterized protein n=1 Tax=Hemiselmis tepida TaxID=464990 RepID=A0A7S0VTJ1_9CRYP
MEELAAELASDQKSAHWGVTEKEVHYVTLLSEGRDGSPSLYANALRKQLYQQRAEYAEDIKRHIIKSRGGDEDPGSVVTAKQVRQSLRQVDPDKPQKEGDEVLQRIFGRKQKGTWGDVSARLALVWCERTTPRADRRVQFALRPPSDLLRMAQKKTRHVLLCIRVAKAFAEAGAEWRERHRPHPP